MPYLSGAQVIIATLRVHNVDTIFGVPGNHILSLYDALRAEPALHHILARHEQGAGFMAEGYARASGCVGVAFTITGPGATNITTSVADAHADSVPLLVISSSLPGPITRQARGLLHETKNQLGMMEALAGWSRVVTHVEEIPAALHDAFRTLYYRRPGAAYLQIPYDLLDVAADVEISELAQEDLIQPGLTEIAAAAHLLREAQRPLIVAGAGVTTAGANEQLAQLAELLQAPILLGSKSHDVLPTHHPLVVTSTGYDLVPELRSLVSNSDAVLVVGSKLSAERTAEGGLPLPAALIHIDIDPEVIGCRYPATVGIVADARLALDTLLVALQDLPRTRPSHAHEVAAATQALRNFTRQSLGEAVTLLDALRAALPQETIVIADMTMLGYASARYFPVYGSRTFIHPVEFCPIGCGLPLAIGVKVAAPEQPVVALCGDGGFLLNTGELATVVQERLDIIIVVFNDRAFTAVKKAQHQRLEGRYMATDLVVPDFVALARAFGIKGVLAQDPGELQAAVSTAIQEGVATLIEVPLPEWHWYTSG